MTENDNLGSEIVWIASDVWAVLSREEQAGHEFKQERGPRNLQSQCIFLLVSRPAKRC
jgi:hypothetical protein